MGGLARRIESFADGIDRLGRWPRRGILLAAGAGATLALPPLGLWPVLYPAFWLLSRMADDAAARGRRALFGAGWWFAFGYLAAGWYWIANALLVFSDRLWWMVPFAALGLPAAMAVYYGLAALATRPVRAGLPRALALAGLFVAADWLRGHLFTGFPWNSWGYVWADGAWLSQGAALFGVTALGALALASAALVSGALAGMAAGRVRPALALLAGAVLIPVAIAGYGAARLANAPALGVEAGTPGLRIVQAGIPQREKWARRYARRNLDRHLSLSRDGRPDWVTHVIWPETAAAFFIEAAPAARAEIAAVVPSGGLLLTGAPRRRADPPALRNAMVALDETGAITATYDKHHLVPFGEYVPLKDWLPFDKVTAGATDYAPGDGPATLALKGLPPVSPLICYEVIFPGEVVAAGTRPAWLLNLTNDAWYGHTAGPYQHLQHARLRAVERGLPLIRAANTGISAGFDPYGRELGRLPLGASGALDIRLPSPAAAPPLYARAGDWMLIAILSLVLLGAGLAHRRRA